MPDLRLLFYATEYSPCEIIMNCGIVTYLLPLGNLCFKPEILYWKQTTSYEQNTCIKCCTSLNACHGVPGVKKKKESWFILHRRSSSGERSVGVICNPMQLANSLTRLPDRLISAMGAARWGKDLVPKPVLDSSLRMAILQNYYFKSYIF